MQLGEFVETTRAVADQARTVCACSHGKNNKQNYKNRKRITRIRNQYSDREIAAKFSQGYAAKKS